MFYCFCYSNVSISPHLPLKVNIQPTEMNNMDSQWGTGADKKLISMVSSFLKKKKKILPFPKITDKWSFVLCGDGRVVASTAAKCLFASCRKLGCVWQLQTTSLDACTCSSAT
jgi:hypothetical protein